MIRAEQARKNWLVDNSVEKQVKSEL